MRIRQFAAVAALGVAALGLSACAQSLNTTVSRYNLADLDKMTELLASLRVVLWSVFFLVPTGRAHLPQMLSPEEHERVFAKLHAASKRMKFHYPRDF